MSIGNLKDSGNQGNNLPFQWKVLQGLQEIANQVGQPLTCVEDSVTICNDNIDAFTFTNIAGDDALNVNIAGGVTLEVNLDPDNDSVGVYGYTNPADPSTFTGIKVDSSGVLAIQDNGSSITVDGTVALDSATLIALENITVQNGAGAAAVNIQDGGNSITVDGTVTANAGTGNFTVVQATASNLNATVVGGTGPQRIATFLRPSGSNGTVGPNIYSASFASVGTANAIVGGINLKPGETLNFDAGAINNTLAAITYNTLTNSGAELIIITLT